MSHPFAWDGEESTESDRVFMRFLGGPRDGERLRTLIDNLPHGIDGEGGGYVRHRPWRLPGPERRLIAFDYLWVGAILSPQILGLSEEDRERLRRLVREEDRRRRNEELGL